MKIKNIAINLVIGGGKGSRGNRTALKRCWMDKKDGKNEGGEERGFTY